VKTESNTRPLRINLSLKSDVVVSDIKQVFSSDAIQFVASPEEADLVIFDDLREAEKGFVEEKSYAYLFGMQPGQKKLVTPFNVLTIPVSEAVVRLSAVINDISKKIQPITHLESVA